MAEGHKELKAVFQGNCDFTRNLYTLLAGSPGNVFFSPLSIHAILSLMHQGASGRTKEAFSKALNVGDEKIAALGYRDVMAHFNSMRHVTLHMANKIFLQETYQLEDSFKSVAEGQFMSEVDVLDFRKASAAAKSINTWVEKKTNNKIKDIFNPDDIDDDTALVLVNAIYFKGEWLEPFDASDTTIEPFYLNNYDTVDVQMMHMSSNFYYKEDEELGAQILRLPYTNLNFSMVIILPKERNGIAELEEKLACADLTKITLVTSKAMVRVSLPKFRIEQTVDLQDPLTRLGLGVMFTKDAEFPGLIKSPGAVYVSKAIQKTFIEVNEEGTEAAAVTGMETVDFCGMLHEELTFTADQYPFVVFLRATHKNSTTVLFEGRISNP